MNREPIAVALFAKVSTPSVKTPSRVLRSVMDMQPSDCPALFMIPSRYPTQRTTGLPAKRYLNYLLYVYTKRGSNEEVPDTQINAVLDEIEQALEPAPGTENQTLGGLCDWCRIEGDIETDAGALGDAALAVIPIRIQVTAS